MLYLHCGWPHTGTSSFQAALHQSRDRLAADGLLYPDMGGMTGGHHQLLELLDPGAGAGASLGRFRECLAAGADRAVLVSTEGLSGWFEERSRPSILRLLRAAREVTPVTCILTLRRADELFVSRYNHRIQLDQSVAASSPTAYSLTTSQWNVALGFMRWLTGLEGLSEVDEALDGRVVYCIYDERGAHHDRILSAAGVSRAARDEVMERLRQAPRLNALLSRKALVALLHLDAISAEFGAPLSRRALIGSWRSGRLRFADDAPCELVETDVRRAAHEQALEASRHAALDPYTELLEGVAIEPSAPVSLDLDLLTDEDLERLAACAAA